MPTTPTSPDPRQDRPSGAAVSTALRDEWARESLRQSALAFDQRHEQDRRRFNQCAAQQRLMFAPRLAAAWAAAVLAVVAAVLAAEAALSLPHATCAFGASTVLVSAARRRS